VRKLVLGTLCTFLIGCVDEQHVQVNEKNQGLVYCAEANPVSFNPQVTTTGSTIDLIANQLYDRLISIDPVSAEFKPELAEFWAVSDDGITVTFYLRQGV
jgi:cationic peptide transport system substrate-binding protein